MPNPWIKYITKEQHLQKQVMDYIKYQYPKIMVHHSPMEGKRSKFEQFILKWMGADSGFPDIVVPVWNLAIELKIKPNKTTENQRRWLEHLSNNDWTAVVIYDLDAAIKVIDEASVRTLDFK